MQASLYNTSFFGVNPRNISSLPQSQLLNISQVHLDMQVLNTPNFASEGSPLHVINTAFDHELEFNKKLGFPPKNKKKHHRYTQKERSYVEKVTKCTSLDDFQEKVCLFFSVEINSQMFIQQIISQLSYGSKPKSQEYIKLSHENLEGCVFLYVSFCDSLLIIPMIANEFM
jgi:hypothetical protein